MGESGFDVSQLEGLPIFDPISKGTEVKLTSKTRNLLVLRTNIGNKLWGGIDATWLRDDEGTNIGLQERLKLLKDMVEHAKSQGIPDIYASDLEVEKGEISPEVVERLTDNLSELTGGKGWHDYEPHSDSGDVGLDEDK